MSARYVRDLYRVDYKRGDRVTVDGKPGRIVSFPGQYLGIRFDHEPRTTVRAHPTWRVAPEHPAAEASKQGRGDAVVSGSTPLTIDIP